MINSESDTVRELSEIELDQVSGGKSPTPQSTEGILD